MSTLARHRCRLHGQREAVALCVGCGRALCRECVTEHTERILCAACLQAEESEAARATPRARSRWFDWIWAGWGYALVALVFYGLGRILVALPSTFHEGTFWGRLTGFKP